jgi:cytochrome bd ubiquinol oxidase subunit I
VDCLWPPAHRRFGVAVADGADVAISLLGYSVVYIVMFSAGGALMARLVGRGPAGLDVEPEPIESGRPQAPVVALPHPEPGRGP